MGALKVAATDDDRRLEFLMRVLVIVALLAGGLWAVHAGLFYQTGYQWYESCWNKRKAAIDQKTVSDPKASTPQEGAAWARCELLAEEVTYNLGFVFTGLGWGDRDVVELHKACPSSWSDVPGGGWYMKLVKLMEKQGGPPIWSQFVQAQSVIEHTLKSRWPTCNEVRIKQGYPRIVQIEGEWTWESRCRPCEKNSKP